ncbi:transglutaminase TgpA family protein [Schlesneria paludicola]|uniref:transglutaminase TgpA family protein n=1 Tax=Schlesneria paludicola TaxID=360056 RepID=UPI00029B1465|nr:DUF3488 and transglutaminase-like domain-containing protein [Schlesneria paludicola]
MELGTVFKISLYGLTALIGIILGLAEGEGSQSYSFRSSLLLPFLSVPVVIGGYLVTERKSGRTTSPGLGLSSTWANVLGMMALIATGYEFSGDSREGKLLAGTHLLLYVTWIVLFQQKTIRLYWFLLALGILQLAVASVLTSKGWFGFCAVGYMFCAVWTLSIFSLWRAEQMFEEENLRRIEGTPGETLAQPLTRGNRASQSEVQSAVQHEEGTQWLTARFVTGVLLTTCSALLVSTAFFAFIPRVWVGPDFSLQDDANAMSGLVRKTGLAGFIKLGDLGRVLESTERVFEIQLTNRETKANIPVEDYAQLLGMAEPLFRGAVFTKYEKGRWSPSRGNEFHIVRFTIASADAAVRQNVRLEPTTSQVLYCLGSPLAMTSRRIPFGDFDALTGVAMRNEVRGELNVTEYLAYSNLPTVEQPYYAIKVSPDTRSAYYTRGYLKDNTELPKGLSQLKELARHIVEQETARIQRAENRSKARELTPFEKATAIEYYLRESGIYKYSLDLAIHDSTIDPVEDFLVNRKSGHCEYFATALALMLRSVDIPARVVSGFKGGITHPDGSFEVQQRFAHLWVDAWVDHEKWTTFDATPLEARSLSVAEVAAKKSSVWQGVQTTLSGLWSENVLNMSLDRQEQSIYKPMRELAYMLATLVEQLFTSPESAMKTLWNLLTDREKWFSVGGFLFIFIGLLLLTGITWLIRWSSSRLRDWWLNRIDQGQQRRQRIVAFYERFAKLMRSRGMKRKPSQTQREFAEEVAMALASELPADADAMAPNGISQAFYRVRFGEEELTNDEVIRLEQDIMALEKVLSKQPSSHHRSEAAMSESV